MDELHNAEHCRRGLEEKIKTYGFHCRNTRCQGLENKKDPERGDNFHKGRMDFRRKEMVQQKEQRENEGKDKNRKNINPQSPYQNPVKTHRIHRQKNAPARQQKVFQEIAAPSRLIQKAQPRKPYPMDPKQGCV